MLFGAALARSVPAYRDASASSAVQLISSFMSGQMPIVYSRAIQVSIELTVEGLSILVAKMCICSFAGSVHAHLC